MKDVSDVKMITIAELETAVSTSQVVRFEYAGSSGFTISTDDFFLLDMCITPRPEGARGCYSKHWSQFRYEPLGKIFVVPPRKKLHVLSDGNIAHTSLVCRLHPEAIDAGLAQALEWSDETLEGSLDIQHRYIQSLLIRLAGETSHPVFASDVFAEHLMAQLAIELARYLSRVKDTKLHTGGLASWRLRIIDERLAELRPPPTLMELANECRLSVRQMTRAFNNSKGCSLGDYITRSRVDHAKRMLIAGEEIKNIASKLGFASASSFTSTFRRATGSTPRAFKQRAPHKPTTS